MLRLSLFCLLLFLPFSSPATQIPIGYHSNLAKVWRFYERNKAGIYEPRLLVYNTSREPITVMMKVILHGQDMDARAMGILTKFTGFTTDTVIRPVTIPVKGYGIYPIEQVAANRSTGFFDNIVINGRSIGICSIMPTLQAVDPAYKYYAYEGLDGSTICMIGTNELMATPGKEGHMLLHFIHVDRIRNNYWNFANWTIDLSLLKGNSSVTALAPDGKEYSISANATKTTIPVNVASIDSFSISATYLLPATDTLPEAYLALHFCNGCSTSLQLPLLLKRE